jgi:UDP:flavonoid glycosyltransferase YjiC (YdhE family)
MLEIAKASRDYFTILFISYGGQCEPLIEQEGFKLIKMEPRLTEKKLRRLKVILRGDTLNTVGYLSYRELVPRVKAEVELFTRIKPAAVLTGWCLSTTISTRAAHVPFINVLHSTSITEYYEQGLQTYPDRIHFLARFIPEEKLNERINRRVLAMKWVVNPYNRLGKQYGLREFHNFVDLLEGDYTLLADIPEWVNLPGIRSNKKYVGPLVARLRGEIPDEIKNLSREKPVIYFAMGSSGKPRLIADIIKGFKNKQYTIIAPVKNHIQDVNIDIPANVVITGFIPAHKVNPMAHISVIHGGQNSVMQACLSGTPIVGMGMHPEQEANLEACVRKGFAIRLNKWTVKPADVLKAIDDLLHNRQAKNEVVKFQKQLQAWDGPANAARFLDKTFNQVGVVV